MFSQRQSPDLDDFDQLASQLLQGLIRVDVPDDVIRAHKLAEAERLRDGQVSSTPLPELLRLPGRAYGLPLVCASALADKSVLAHRFAIVAPLARTEAEDVGVAQIRALLLGRFGAALAAEEREEREAAAAYEAARAREAARLEPSDEDEEEDAPTPPNARGRAAHASRPSLDEARSSPSRLSLRTRPSAPTAAGPSAPAAAATAAASGAATAAANVHVASHDERSYVRRGRASEAHGSPSWPGSCSSAPHGSVPSGLLPSGLQGPPSALLAHSSSREGLLASRMTRRYASALPRTCALLHSCKVRLFLAHTTPTPCPAHRRSHSNAFSSAPCYS
jgi:hypothetical protein